jgi:hypothetical protein
MQKTIIVIAVIECISFSFNDLGPLALIEEKAQNFYDLGVEDNYIHSKIMTEKVFRKEFENYKKELLEDNDEIKISLSQWVFMPRGAYGEHIPFEVSLSMANNLIWYINFFNISVIAVEKSFILGSDGIFSSVCAIALLAQGNVLLMQACAMDDKLSNKPVLLQEFSL